MHRLIGAAELANRELEVLRHIARGLSNAEIANALYVSKGPMVRLFVTDDDVDRLA